MTTLSKTLTATAIAVAMGVGALATTATTASAAVVCNSAGDCWHTDRHYNYNRNVGAVYHPDDWYFHRDWDHDTEHHWRQYHEGRGYYSNGTWTPY